MASSKIRGITIEIGGDTTKLGKAIEDSEAKSRSLQGELKQVEKLLKMDPGNVELLAQKQEILTRAVSETSDRLKTLREAQEQVERQFKNGDIGEDQYRAFQRELIKTEKELNNLEDVLKDIEEQLKKTDKGARESGNGFTIMGGALAELTANVISGAVSKVGDLIGSLFELSEATEEYRTMQAKLEGSAETFGYSMDFANGKYEEFYKYLGDDQASTNAITNLMGLGTSTESVTALADSAIAVWSAYGDSIPIEGLTEALNETAQVGKVTGSLADALNWAGISEDDFNAKLEKCSSTQERADLIAKTLNDTYGDSKKTYDELNDSVLDANEAELALKETQAELGETMAPVNTAITDLKNKALEKILPLVGKLADGFLNLLSWLKEHPTVLKVITAVVIALATAFGVLAVALGIQSLISGVTKAIALLNTTLLANPIVLIVALIAGLVASFIYLWNNCDAFRQFWIDLWEGIKSAFSKVVEWIKITAPKIAEFFVSAWNSIKNCWNAVGSYFSGIWTNIKTTFSSVGTWFKNTFTNAWNAVKNVFSGWSNFFGGLWTTIKNKFSTIGTNIANAISGAVKSGINGVISSIESTINSGIGLINGAIGLINKLPGVNVGTIGEVSFPRLARGGIVNRPTFAQIGEDGSEAVIPLERNTEWIRGVARELNTNNVAQGAVTNTALLNKLDNIYERLNRMQIVLDTGTLVGETIDKIDAGLASNQLLRARGV